MELFDEREKTFISKIFQPMAGISKRRKIKSNNRGQVSFGLSESIKSNRNIRRRPLEISLGDDDDISGAEADVASLVAPDDGVHVDADDALFPPVPGELLIRPILSECTRAFSFQ